ncbi:ASCH domain-containing protein [Archaeoglobus sp.]
MKHLEFKRKYADLLLSGKKRITIRNWTNLKAGDEVYVHCGGKIIGKAKISAVERKKISELTDEEARLDGFSSREDMLEELERIGYGDEVYVIRFDFEPIESVNPHNMYYGDADLVEVAEKSLKHLDLEERDRKVVEIFLMYGSIRKAARKLGGSRKRGEIRKILRKCYLMLKERSLI